MSEQLPESVDPNVIAVEFDPSARQANHVEDLHALPVGERGFLGVHLAVDPATGGIKKDETGQHVPFQPDKPENPFE